MKKTVLFAIALLLLSACKETPRYTIGGNFGNGGDTLYLFGLDSRYDRIDEIVCDEQGAFLATVETDTITPLGLALPDGSILTLFAEPGTDAELITDSLKTGDWIVKGGREQAIWDSISTLITAAESNSGKLVHIENFAREYPFDNANIEIIRRFLIDIPNPDNGRTLKRIKSLGGTLQDHEFFTSIREQIDNKNSNTQLKMFPSFNYTTSEGEKITQKKYKDKLLVVNFWASWDSLSLAELREQNHLFETCDTSRLSVLNISLDYDTAAWKKCITEDSINGDNVCDGKAWNNEIVKRFNIRNLTFSILVSPYQRIEMFDLDNSDLKNAIDSLSKKYFDKEKERKQTRKK